MSKYRSKSNRPSPDRSKYRKVKDRNARVAREEPSKDSADSRVNYDNTRESKFKKDMRVKGIKADQSDFQEAKAGKENDISWYNKVNDLYQPATNVSFQPVTGNPVNDDKPYAVPGIMADYWVPTLGTPDLQAVNQIKASLFSYVVHANSRNTSYDENDLFNVFVGGGQVFCYLATLIRAYGSMSNFQAVNKNVPQALLTAMGFDYQDFADHYPEMLFEINRMITASRQLWVPMHFTFVTRWFWMNSNIYKDAESAKAQLYMHVQDYYWQFSEDAFETGTALIPVCPTTFVPINAKNYSVSGMLEAARNTTGATTNLIKWEDAKNFFWTLLNPLVNSTYRGVMMGDILKAYGPNDLFAVATIDASYQVVPVYSEEVLMQIENATINYGLPMFGLMQDMDNNTIQPVAFTRQDTVPTSSRANWITKPILNFHKVGGPTADDLMIATRLMTPGTTLDNGSVKFNKLVTGYVQEASDLKPYTAVNATVPFVKYTGSEALVDCIVFALQYGTVAAAGGFSYGTGYNISVSRINTRRTNWTRSVNSTTNAVSWTIGSDNDVRSYALWSAFDWAPWIYEIISNGTSTGVPYGSWVDAYGDWDYWGTIPDENIRNMHIAALYSELNVPFMA